MVCRHTALVIAAAWAVFGAACAEPEAGVAYDIVKRAIAVDGKTDDWKDVRANVVAGRSHLWYGQGMTPEKWRGDDDHSYQWRAAWNDNTLYFLFEVTDDVVVDPPKQPNSFLNDCIEILLDPKLARGRRFDEKDGVKTLHGYEMHFLPSAGQLVFVDDAKSPMYPMEKPQNEMFAKEWAGKTAAHRTDKGYVMEIAFSIPGVALKPGMKMGMDTDTCDDDGDGRKSLQIWTGKQVEFWITMDHYGVVTLVE